MAYETAAQRLEAAKRALSTAQSNFDEALRMVRMDAIARGHAALKKLAAVESVEAFVKIVDELAERAAEPRERE